MKPPRTAPAACAAAEYRQFDFWIGDWDTFESDAAQGPSIARARIERIAGGCGLRETYEQTDGLVGESILSFDPVRRQWQQTWITNRGSAMVLRGGPRGEALVLEGEVHHRDGTQSLQRITWQVTADGVRESAMASKDGGRTWAAAFDVLFRERSDRAR